MGCQYITFPLQTALSTRRQTLLEATIRQIPAVISAYAGDGRSLVIYYKGNLSLPEVNAKLQQVVFSSKTTAITQVRPTGEPPSLFAEYRRDAILAGTGLMGLQLLRLAAPGMFTALYLARCAFVLFVARKFIASGVRSLVVERQPNADTLTTTAVMASILGGKPESSLTLLALSNFAEMLTTFTAERARKHISKLLRLDQQYVWKIEEGGHEVRVAVQSLKPGDRVGVHLGEKICVDGRVMVGVGAVDQSSITGEYIPAEKSEGDYVYAGTVLQNGFLEIIVEKIGDDTAVARIVHMVEEAQTRRAPVQNFADRMSNMLVPISFIAAGLVYGATKDWQRVLNMLFIDFSCGLKLSTATAISAAIGRAASRGVLVKGGNYVEALAGIDTVVLDKTGTITIGKPQVVTVKTAPGVRERELLLLAASAEYHSAHPLACAVLEYVESQGWEIPQHNSTETIVARGILAEVPDFEEICGGRILVGSRRFMEEYQIDCQFFGGESGAECGFNLIYVARGEALLGVLVVSDPIRPKMKKTINQLRRQGVDEVVMLTGDTEPVAKHVATALDIDAYHAEVLPEDKAALVNRFRRRSQVLMVGDGVNDAPALAFADVGVAMGGRRTDIAVESAAITINSEDPLVLSEVVMLGKKTMKIVQQNFTATIAVNMAAMLLGAIGRTNPMVSALIHNAATIGVVLNSARILIANKKIR
ncbi:cation-translocating P-type ATPase [Sporomusa sp. KB1]|jgi:cation-transporting P-type ATPase C|uniref:heavy metal translocating P-type ATPase n=1 Tax=Sporomusa sp. KB1 TaxID=943346 RepID=UPI0011AAFC47|nr:cation-translocating P-type ATPase [Sporomusa sp. KB1]TWH46164.1 cation-transporting P-type ATPase C [Sporomusa sp. KB1]